MALLQILTTLVLAAVAFGLPALNPKPPVTPMGQGGCPFLPCPLPSCQNPHNTSYWRTQPIIGKVLCEGCQQCAGPERRELDVDENCEPIICAAIPSTCINAVIREPELLVGKDGTPCPACRVCLDNVFGLPSSP